MAAAGLCRAERLNISVMQAAGAALSTFVSCPGLQRAEAWRKLVAAPADCNIGKKITYICIAIVQTCN